MSAKPAMPAMPVMPAIPITSPVSVAPVSRPVIPPAPQVPPPPVPAQLAQPAQPTASTAQPAPDTPNFLNYGVDDVLGESRLSDPSSVASTECEKAPVLEDEVCYTLPFRQGGFFRTWLNSYFVIDYEKITMYPNEKRNERKSKEILLYDATVGVGDEVRCEA